MSRRAPRAATRPVSAATVSAATVSAATVSAARVSAARVSAATVSAATVSAAMVLAACVGPATTVSAYEGKAVRTANDALSEVQTARLAAQTSLRGKLSRAYLEVVLQNSEDAFSSIQNTFDSIQPPNAAKADDMRDALDTVLTDGSGALSQLRIDARRDDTAGMRSDVDDLGPVAQKLNAFSQEHA
jgi:hypothetical protein